MSTNDREANDKLHDDVSGVPGLHRAIDDLRDHGVERDAEDGVNQHAIIAETALRESQHQVDFMFAPIEGSHDMRFIETHVAGTNIGISVGEWIDGGEIEGDGDLRRFRVKLAKGNSNEQVDRLAQYLLDEHPTEIVEGRDATDVAIAVMSKEVSRKALDYMDKQLLDSAQQLCQWFIATYPQLARESGGNTIGPKLVMKVIEAQELSIDTLLKENATLRQKSWLRRTWNRLFGKQSTITPLRVVNEAKYPFQCDDCDVMIVSEDDHIAHHAATGH